jgi:hypothetical protein
MAGNRQLLDSQSAKNLSLLIVTLGLVQSSYYVHFSTHHQSTKPPC